MAEKNESKPKVETKPEPEGARPVGTPVNVVVAPGMVILGPKGSKSVAGETVAVPSKAFAKFPKMGTLAK